jgi:hypothetical protein
MDTDNGTHTAKRYSRAALFLISTQLVLMVTIAVYFAIVTNQQNHVLANSALLAEKQNTAVIGEIRNDLATHGVASASRSCASFHLLADLLRSSNRKTHALTKNQLRTINVQQAEACLYQPPPLVRR